MPASQWKHGAHCISADELCTHPSCKNGRQQLKNVTVKFTMRAMFAAPNELSCMSYLVNQPCLEATYKKNNVAYNTVLVDRNPSLAAYSQRPKKVLEQPWEQENMRFRAAMEHEMYILSQQYQPLGATKKHANLL